MSTAFRWEAAFEDVTGKALDDEWARGRREHGGRQIPRPSGSWRCREPPARPHWLAAHPQRLRDRSAASPLLRIAATDLYAPARLGARVPGRLDPAPAPARATAART